MIGSNEDYWREYQKEPAKGLRKARQIQSGVDPDESFHFIRGLMFIGCVIAVIGGILFAVFT